MTKGIRGFGETIQSESARMEEFDRALLKQSQRDFRATMVGGSIVIVALIAVAGFFLFR